MSSATLELMVKGKVAPGNRAPGLIPTGEAKAVYVETS